MLLYRRGVIPKKTQARVVESRFLSKEAPKTICWFSNISVMHEEEQDALASMSELPEELLVVILYGTHSAEAVTRCATVCHKFACASRSEWLWQMLCESTWPMLWTPRACPAVHLRALPPESWKSLFRSRVTNMSTGSLCGVCELLRLYDSSTCLATARHAGWVVELGMLLLRIERAHTCNDVSHPSNPTIESRNQPRAASFSDETECWARTMQCKLLAGASDVLALVGKSESAQPPPQGEQAAIQDDHVSQTPESLSCMLDAWHECIESGLATRGSMAGDEAMQLLLRALVTRSALATLSSLFDFFECVPTRAPVGASDGAPIGASVRALARHLADGIEKLDEDFVSLRLEGCDLSITAAQRAAAIGPVGAEHWWWWLDPPCYVSGGCPLIPR